MPLPASPYPACMVEFDAKGVPSDAVRSLTLELNVEFQADTAEIVLDNADAYSDGIAKESGVNIWLGYVRDPLAWHKDELAHVFSGGTDGVLPSWGQDTTLTIRARDWTRLLIDEQADPGWAWMNMTDADFVRQLAERAGLQADIAPAAQSLAIEDWASYDFYAVPTVTPTGWDIIQRLAVRNGYVAYVTVDKRLYFGPRGGLGTVPIVGGALSAASGAASIGVWTYFDDPHDLLAVEFDDSALVVNKVTVARWLGLDGPGFISGSAVDDGRLKAARGRVIERTLVSTTAKDPAACETEAKARLKELARAAITARATVEGDPRLVGDALVTLAGKRLGRFKGDYYISAATHRFGTDGYTCDLQLSSVRPEASEVYRPALGGDALNPDEAVGAQAALTPTCGDGPLVDLVPDEWQEFGPGGPSSAPVARFLEANGVSALVSEAVCGPIAAAGMLKAYGIATDPGQLTKRAMQGDSGGAWWTSGDGMAGTDGEIKLLGSQGLVASDAGASQAEAIKRTSLCRPVIFNTPHHFLLAQAYRADGRFFVGNTGSNALRNGQDWMSWAEIAANGGTGGAVYSVIVADVPPPTVTASSAANGQTRGAMGRASSDVQAVIRAGGWPEAQWDNAAAIVQAESGGNPRDVSPTGDYGLFQINLATWKGETCDFLGLPRGTSDAVVIERLFDPLTNSQMAYRIWKEVGHWGYPGGWATAAGLGLA